MQMASSFLDVSVCIHATFEFQRIERHMSSLPSLLSHVPFLFLSQKANYSYINKLFECKR